MGFLHAYIHAYKKLEVRCIVHIRVPLTIHYGNLYVSLNNKNI